MANYILVLNSLLAEFKDKLDLLDGSVEREFAFPEMVNKIKVAIGVRRSGKTFLCLQYRDRTACNNCDAGGE